MSNSLKPEHYTKYQSLVAERNRLKKLLDKHAHMVGTGNWKAVRAQYELRIRQIKQLYKTHM